MTPPTETPAPPRGWWGPSLMRRTLLALLAAMALVWLVLLGQAAITHYRAMDTNPGVRQLAQGLAGALATLEQPCLLYTSPSPRDKRQSRMPSSA